MYRILEDHERARLNHRSYGKLVDDVYKIGTNTILRMNVILYKTSPDGTRYLYHKEVGYKDNNMSSMKIKRSFDYYLSIENFVSDSDGYKEFIQIRVENIPMIRNVLQQVYGWFTNKKYENLYAINDKHELIMPMKVRAIVLDGLPMGRFISFIPIIINYNTEYDKEIQQSRGVRIFLNSHDRFVDISLNRFLGFYQSIMDINLYNAAQNMLSYFGRPEFGFNGFIVDDSDQTYDIQVKSTRKIGDSNKKKFDDLF